MRIYLKNCVLFLWIFLQVDPPETKAGSTVELGNGSAEVVHWDQFQSVKTHIYGTNAMFPEFILEKRTQQYNMKYKFECTIANNPHLNIDLDGCENLEAAQSSKPFQVMYNNMFSIANQPKTCLVLNKTYFLDKYVNKIKLGDYFLASYNIEWKFIIDFVVDKKDNTSVILFGRLNKN